MNQARAFQAAFLMTPERRQPANAVSRVTHDLTGTVDKWVEMPALLATLAAGLLLLLPQFAIFPPPLWLAFSGWVPSWGWGVALTAGGLMQAAGRAGRLDARALQHAATFVGATWAWLWVAVLLSGKLSPTAWVMPPLLFWFEFLLSVRFHIWSCDSLDSVN